MKLIELKCPNCASMMQIDSSNKEAYCQFCGTKIAIDDEVQHIQYDNAEQAGYEFEKGRQRAQAEYQQQYQPEKKKHILLWVLGWIFFFPIPLTVLIARSKKLDKRVKAILIAVLWIAILIYGATTDTDSDNNTNSQSESTSVSQTAQSPESALLFI